MVCLCEFFIVLFIEQYLSILLYFFQLILSLPFKQAVKIHSIKIKAPADKGPKTLRLFINQPNTLDFDTACSNQAVQDIT